MSLPGFLMFGNKISVSNDKRVFTQLKPPVKVFSDNSRRSLLVGKDIIILKRSLSVSLSVSLPLCLSLCLSRSLSVSLFVFLSVSLSLFVSLCVSLSVSLCLSLSLSVCLSLAVSLSVPPSLCLSVSLFLWNYSRYLQNCKPYLSCINSNLFSIVSHNKITSVHYEDRSYRYF